MPELPEVESLVRALRETSLIGKTLSSVHLICPKIPTHVQTLAGRRLLDIRRRGKYLYFSFSGAKHLIVHLRMTGQFVLKTVGEIAARHERVLFHFEDNLTLAFHDTRRFVH